MSISLLHVKKEREMVNKNQQNLLSKMATGNGHGENSPYFDGWKAFEDNPFHPTDNPHGVIQMGLAQNQLSFDLVEEWPMKNPEASFCTPEEVTDFRDIAIFQDYHGLTKFRNAVANFMEKVKGNKMRFDPDSIVMSGGATGAHEMTVFHDHCQLPSLTTSSVDFCSPFPFLF